MKYNLLICLYLVTAVLAGFVNSTTICEGENGETFLPCQNGDVVGRYEVSAGKEMICVCVVNDDGKYCRNCELSVGKGRLSVHLNSLLKTVPTTTIDPCFGTFDPSAGCSFWTD